MKRAVALVAMMLTPFVAGAQPPPQGETNASAFELAPGVVVDSVRGAVFVMLPDETIARLDLETGSRDWTSELRGKPLGVVGGRLFAQLETGDGSLEIARLDARGARETDVRIPLPAGISATLADTFRGAFSARLVESGSDPVVAWQYVPRPRSGALLPDRAPDQSVLRGASALDPVTLRARTVDPEAVGGSRLSPPDAVRAWGGAPSLWQKATVVDALWIAPTRPESGPGVALKRWDGRTGTSSEVLLTADPVAVVTFSADGRHLLASEAASPGEWNEHTWSIYSTRTAERIGGLEHHRSSAPFFVRGRTLVFVQGPYLRNVEGELEATNLQLRAFDLTGGAPLWELEIRDTTYRGPFPE